MVKVVSLKLFFLALGIVILLFVTFNETNLFDSVLATSKPSVSYACGYNNITSVFQQHGMPSSSLIREIEKIDSKYLSVLVTNLLINRTELYLYGLGNDLVLNTTDDFAISLGGMYEFTAKYISPVLAISNGTTNETLYWVNNSLLNKEIKSCQITPQGCTNVRTLAALPMGLLDHVIPSFNQDRLYIVYTYKNVTATIQRDISVFRSCSIARGLNDSCNRNFSDYTIHSYSNGPGITFDSYRQLPAIGFMALPNYPIFNYTVHDPDNQTYLFDINAPNPTIRTMPDVLDLDSIISAGLPGIMIAVKQDLYNYTNDSVSIVDVYSGTSTEVDYLNVHYDKSYLIDINSNIILVYEYAGKIFEKLVGSDSIPIYSYVQNETIVPKAIMDDKSVIGLIPEKFTVVKFRCKA